MDTYNARLIELVEVAEHAYEKARIEVFNHWPAGRPVDPAKLSDRQRAVYSKLLLAEAELEAYRADQYYAERQACDPVCLATAPRHAAVVSVD